MGSIACRSLRQIQLPLLSGQQLIQCPAEALRRHGIQDYAGVPPTQTFLHQLAAQALRRVRIGPSLIGQHQQAAPECIRQGGGQKRPIGANAIAHMGQLRSAGHGLLQPPTVCGQIQFHKCPPPCITLRKMLKSISIHCMRGADGLCPFL